MGPAIRENVSCDIDYGVSLSLVVIDICLLHFLHIFHYGKMELWRSSEFRARYSRTLTLDTRWFRKGLNSIAICYCFMFCDVKIIIFVICTKNCKLLF
jgi:hypothetical protein